MIIDLCCGQGRFKSPDEQIISIDIDKRMHPTICADVEHLPLRPKLKPKLCHASPPCRYFSRARLSRGHGYDERGVAASLRLVAACFDAFAYLEAKNWTLENPSGLLEKILPSNATTTYTAYDCTKKTTRFWTNNKGIKRAIIPQEIRQKILDCC
jgi:site-specific DNA-cytosine methylase